MGTLSGIIRAHHRAMTPGKWVVAGKVTWRFGWRINDTSGYNFVSVFHRTGATAATPPSRMDAIDAEGIAYLRNNALAIADTLDTLTTEVERLQGGLKRIAYCDLECLDVVDPYCDCGVEDYGPDMMGVCFASIAHQVLGHDLTPPERDDDD